MTNRIYKEDINSEEEVHNLLHHHRSEQYQEQMMSINEWEEMLDEKIQLAIKEKSVINS